MKDNSGLGRERTFCLENWVGPVLHFGMVIPGLKKKRKAAYWEMCIQKDGVMNIYLTSLCESAF